MLTFGQRLPMVPCCLGLFNSQAVIKAKVELCWQDQYATLYNIIVFVGFSVIL